MRFSIIVPFYNEYIGECLESLVKQSYEDFEIVMIDDGSSDGSSEIALSYAEKDSRISVIRQINGGVSKARNVAEKPIPGASIPAYNSTLRPFP